MKGSKINIGAAYSRGNDVMIQKEVMKAMQIPVNLHAGPSQGTVDRYKRIGHNKADQVDENLFIGNEDSASDLDWLTSTGISHIINCAKEIPNFYEGQLRYLRLDLADGQNEVSTEDDLYRVAEGAYRYINSILRRDPKVKILVHCRAGISRSSSIVVYYLMRRRGMSYDQALKYLKDRRPIVSPNTWYEKQLRDMDMALKNKVTQ